MYDYGLYDQRGMLDRVLEFDSAMKLTSIYVLENSDRYQTCTIRMCDAAGTIRSSMHYEALDEQGQPVLGDDPARVGFYSSHYEEIMAPTRVGFQPYYPMPAEDR